jgi:hypothetical protein
MSKKQRLEDRYNMDGNQVTSAKDFVHKATDLQDHETKRAMQVIAEVQGRYQYKRNTPDNLDALRDEILTKLAEVGILATFDPVPMLSGEPPILEIVGKVWGDPIHKYGFDHEQKAYEVQEAEKRGEDYRGQKERDSKRD